MCHSDLVQGGVKSQTVISASTSSEASRRLFGYTSCSSRGLPSEFPPLETLEGRLRRSSGGMATGGDIAMEVNDKAIVARARRSIGFSCCFQAAEAVPVLEEVRDTYEKLRNTLQVGETLSAIA
jgi:hypothetical protein